MKRIFQRIRRTLRTRRTNRPGNSNLTHLRPCGEQLEPRQLLSADFLPWHNYALPEDVNADGEVSLQDAVLLHRELLTTMVATPARQSQPGGGSPLTPGARGGADMFPDVNGDNQLTPEDADQLASRLSPSPEGTGELAFYDLRIYVPDTNTEFGAGENEATVQLDAGLNFELRVYTHDTRLDMSDQYEITAFAGNSSMLSEGMTFAITDSLGNSEDFEFTTDGNFSGNAVFYDPGDPDIDVADSIWSAIDLSGLAVTLQPQVGNTVIVDGANRIQGDGIGIYTDKGIARGHVDVDYLANAFDVTGPIVFAPDYLYQTLGDATVDGKIEAAGGTQTDTQLAPPALGPAPVLLWSVPMVAETVGSGFSIASAVPAIAAPNSPFREDYATQLSNASPGMSATETTIDEFEPGSNPPVVQIILDEIFVNINVPPAQAVDDAFTAPEYPESGPVVPTEIDVLLNDLKEDPPGSTTMVASSLGDFEITAVNGVAGPGPFTTANGGTVMVVDVVDGLVTHPAAALQYTPPASDFISESDEPAPDGLPGPGPDTFTYTAALQTPGPDFGFEITGTVAMTVVNADNDAPLAVDDPGTAFDLRFETTEDSPKLIDPTALTENDSDPDLVPVVFSDAYAIGATLGTVSVVNNQVVYDPNGQFESLAAGDTATDTFEYVIVDFNEPGNAALNATATVTITINGVNDAPTEPPGGLDLPITGTTGDNTPWAYDLSTLGLTDPEGHTISFVAPNNQSGQGGTLTVFNGIVTYNPDASPALNALLETTDELTDTFIVWASDGNGGILEIPFSIVVTGEDDPLIQGTVPGVGTFTDEPTTFYADLNLPPGQTPNLLGDWSDADSGVILSGIASASGAPVVVNPDGSVTYDPTGFFEGVVYPDTDTDTITITVTSDTDPNDFYDIVVQVALTVDVFLPPIRGTVIYADVNQNGRHDAWERTISGVQVQLTGIDIDGNPVNLSATTDADGNFVLDGVKKPLVSYTLTEIQPRFLVEGIDPIANEKIYTISTKADVQTTDYVFSELGLYPQFIHPQDYLSSTRSSGIVFALDASGNQLWYSLMRDGWDNVRNVVGRMNAAGTQFTLTVDGRTKTFATANNIDFFHRGENANGMVVQIYGSWDDHFGF